MKLIATAVLPSFSAAQVGLRFPLPRSLSSRRAARLVVRSAASEESPVEWWSLEPQIVRDTELDQYSVVNNANYSIFFQHARHEYLHALGFNADEVARSGQAFALSEMKIKFISPLRSRDYYRADLRVSKITPARIIFDQRLVRLPKSGELGAPGDSSSESVVATAEATVVCLDKEYRPVRVPQEFREAFQRGPGSDTATQGAAMVAKAAEN